MKSRINLRLKFKDYTFFFMISKTQTLDGLMSMIPDDREFHYPMWDLEITDLDSTFNDIEYTLLDVQDKFQLSDIFIMSDKDLSYRAICFTRVTFKTLMNILYNTCYVDYNFIHWTQSRGYANIRMSEKENRKPLEVISILKTYHQPIPEYIYHKIYDTGIEKSGKTIDYRLFGDK